MLTASKTSLPPASKISNAGSSGFDAVSKTAAVRQNGS